VPLPAALRVRGTGIVLRALQDPASEALAKVPPGDELVPQGKVSGSGEVWFLARAKSGALGWVRASEVEEVVRAK
jgi:hypothetical protein